MLPASNSAFFASRQVTMRLLSWNIHKCIGGRDRRYSLQRVLDCIDHEQPDLICLQEVDRLVRRSSFDDQPRLLARGLGMCPVFQSNVTVGDGTYGNLVLSRYPMGSRHRISLKRGLRKSRGAQLVFIDAPAGPLHLCNTHLGLDERERHWQMERLLGHRLFRSAEPLPTVIVGDFNDWRDTLADNALRREGFHQVTSPVSDFRSFPAWLPVGGLDKAFIRGRIEIDQARIIRTSLAQIASDHLPLVIDFQLI